MTARWPTADEIAELRARVDRLRSIAADFRHGWFSRSRDLDDVADHLAALLDRLDPPQPEPQADDVDPDEALARLFHETYERLAPSYGYSTRRESAVPWEAVPEPNRRLMVAVAAEVRTALDARGSDD